MSSTKQDSKSGKKKKKIVKSSSGSSQDTELKPQSVGHENVN